MVGASAAAAAAIAMAIKASGVVVRVDPVEFQKLLRKIEDPLIVYNEGGFFSKKFRYLVSYKGLAFFTSSSESIHLPPGVEIINAKSMWMPQ